MLAEACCRPYDGPAAATAGLLLARSHRGAAGPRPHDRTHRTSAATGNVRGVAEGGHCYVSRTRRRPVGGEGSDHGESARAGDHQRGGQPTSSPCLSACAPCPRSPETRPRPRGRSDQDPASACAEHPHRAAATASTGPTRTTENHRHPEPGLDDLTSHCRRAIGRPLHQHQARNGGSRLRGRARGTLGADGRPIVRSRVARFSPSRSGLPVCGRTINSSDSREPDDTQDHGITGPGFRPSECSRAPN